MAYTNRDIKSIYHEIKNISTNKKGKLYIFLDEIQKLNGWEKLVNSHRLT